jgi:hypothetical protein
MIGDLNVHLDSTPVAIYMREDCGPGQCAMTGGEEALLGLVVGGAGKVRSAKLDNATLKGQGADALLESVLRRKFIPATKMGFPVACGIQLTASLYQ